MISAVVITRNEESNITRCLSSVKWTTEQVVVDSGSTDRTVELALALGARVKTMPWQGFGPAKQAAVDLAEGPWILSIDADEEVTPALAQEIRQVIRRSNPPAGYAIPRCTYFLNRWIRHGAWYPDRVVRLFQKEKGRFTSAPVHEVVELTGRTARLHNDLLHYCYPDLNTYLEKSHFYTGLGAEELVRKGRRVTAYDLTLRPTVSWIRDYVFRLGFLDGLEGFLIAGLSANAVLTKYAKARQLWKAHDRERPV